MGKSEIISEYLATIGARGGMAKVPKGTAALTPEQRKEQGRKGAEKRWGKKRATAKKKGSK